MNRSKNTQYAGADFGEAVQSLAPVAVGVEPTLTTGAGYPARADDLRRPDAPRAPARDGRLRDGPVLWQA